MSQDGAPQRSVTPPSPPRRRRGPVLSVVLALALVAVAVVAVLSSRGDGDPHAPGGTPDALELRSTPGDLPRTMDETADSLRAFWSAELERAYGMPFRDLAGGIQAKTPDSPPWTCHGRKQAYDDIRGNAYYCPGEDDDFIAYDAADLLPRLNTRYGALTPAVVLAHEMGHAIQARVAVEAPPVVIELQADCFAGAWVAFAQSSPSDPVAVDPSALDSSVRAIPALRDRPGTPATDPRAHGLAFDRVNAYQTGYESGVDECATLPQGNAVVTELPFRTVTEARTGGNLEFADAVPFFTRALDAFWAVALPNLAPEATYRSPRLDPRASGPLPDCAGDPGYDAAAVTGYCVPSNTLSWATEPLAKVHLQVGDMGTAAALAESWARAGESQAGLETTGPGAQLRQVCLTGAWVAALGADTSSSVRLSPGDIDEVLFVVLSALSPEEATDVQRTSFERTAALRTGLLDGLDGCAQ